MRKRLWIIGLSFMLGMAACTHAADGASSKPVAPSRKIQIEDFDRLRVTTNHVVLDVRTPEEYRAGHVPHSVNLNVHDPDFAKQLKSLDPSKTYLVHCARGKRSALATDQMTQRGLTNVLDFTGGFELWQKSGKPVTK